MPLVPQVGDIAQAVLIGRALRSDRLGDTLLPKRLALPVFASDPLSSVAYATQEILVVLTLGWPGLPVPRALGRGRRRRCCSWWSSCPTARLVHAYPSGGGDYEVAATNLGRNAGLVVASALLVDYVLTVAVSVSAGVDNIISALPALRRGAGVDRDRLRRPAHGDEPARRQGVGPRVRRARPTCSSSASSSMMSAGCSGPFRPRAGRRERRVRRRPPSMTGLAGLALVLLVLRAFASGCTALTGVEAIANGVPAFRKPKSRNAATTLA